MKLLPKNLPVLVLIGVVFIFFRHFFFNGLLPIPSDTIVGLYHPFRDFYVQQYPQGLPFKNFLITDPVRQMVPWRELAISLLKDGEIPFWNPYNMAGTPLLANFQSAVFYPLNIIFVFLPFAIAWSILIFFQPLLGALFLYLYLGNLQLHKWASLFGAVAFAFGGFSIAWMEWGTIVHVGIWLPLILLSVDKIFAKEKLLLWSIVFIFSLVCSFFAGHLQTFFYLLIAVVGYVSVRWWQHGRQPSHRYLFGVCFLAVAVLTAIQSIPTIQFIYQSARDIDQISFEQAGWFVPWKHLIQFIAPDFFGNPTTLNYWGIWNYGEFIGYVGILPLIFAFYAISFRRDRKTLFYGSLLFLSLIFSLPTIFAKIPYILNIPLISTAQPTRILFISDFSIAVLASLGFDFFIRHKKQIIYPIAILAIILAILWIFVLFIGQVMGISPENLLVAKNNLILPTGLLMVSAVILLGMPAFKKPRRMALLLCCIIVIITVFDLIRFGWKFTPFTNKKYLFPSTSAITFLQKQEGVFRIMATDRRIFPPNFSIVYRLQSVDVYDPLYLRRYGELIAASERGEPNITPPFGFNRIITPQNYNSKIIDLLGVKYVLSLEELRSVKLTKVFQEGQTQVYENREALPRAFFVKEIRLAKNKNEAIKMMFAKDFDQEKTAIVETTKDGELVTSREWSLGEVRFAKYSENVVIINTESNGDGFLILTDTFYPTWQAKIDNVATTIYRTDYNFRGIFVPEGKHTIVFYATPLL